METIGWKVGGDQGEGIDSTGDVLATVLNRLGYHVYGYKSFSSRIRGGHTHYMVRIGDRRVMAPSHACHVLVALTQETIDRNVAEVVEGGVVLADEAFGPSLPASATGVTLLVLPLTAMAREAGGLIMRNMVAVGASAQLLGLPLKAFEDYARDKFARKGEAVVASNVAALRAGHEAARERAPGVVFPLPPGDGRARYVMSGNQAMALGAYAAGCRIMAAYPITPATEVMEYLTPLLPRRGGAVVQMEDELASIVLTIGAGFAGVRAMTCTSGPGLSLMQEAIGLAGMTETPTVLIDCQRAGPSTGMPTKNEQSDIEALIHGGHGEAPRIVLAPGTPEQAFSDVVLAFNLAERYQCPVLVASDLSLSLWPQTVESLPVREVTIDRGERVSSEALLAMGKDVFQRYALTESGISPRSIPGQPNGQFLATGAEHGGSGKVTEDPVNRVQMMRKRFEKIRNSFDVPGIVDSGPADAPVLLVGFGSNVGPMLEARELLEAQGLRARVAQVRVLSPFPAAALAPLVAAARDVVVVESNATGQLRRLMGENGVHGDYVRSVLKYDGTLFYPEEIVRSVLEGAGVQEVLR